MLCKLQPARCCMEYCPPAALPARGLPPERHPSTTVVYCQVWMAEAGPAGVCQRVDQGLSSVVNGVWHRMGVLPGVLRPPQPCAHGVRASPHYQHSVVAGAQVEVRYLQAPGLMAGQECKDVAIDRGPAICVLTCMHVSCLVDFCPLGQRGHLFVHLPVSLCVLARAGRQVGYNAACPMAGNTCPTTSC